MPIPAAVSHTPASIKRLNSNESLTGATTTDTQAMDIHDKVHFNSFGKKAWNQMSKGEKVLCFLSAGWYHPKMDVSACSEAVKSLSCLRQEKPKGNETQRFSASFEDGSSFTISYERDGLETTVKLSCRKAASSEEMVQRFTGDDANHILMHLPITIGKDQSNTLSEPSKKENRDQDGMSHTTLFHSIPHDIDMLNMTEMAMTMATLEVDLSVEQREKPLFDSLLGDACSEMISGESRLRFCGVDIPGRYLALVYKEMEERGMGLESGKNHIEKGDRGIISTSFASATSKYRLDVPLDTPEMQAIAILTRDTAAQAACLASMSQAMLFDFGEARQAYRGNQMAIDDMKTGIMFDDEHPLGTRQNSRGGTSVIPHIRKFEVIPMGKYGGYHATSIFAKPFRGQEVYIEVIRGEIDIPHIDTNVENLDNPLTRDTFVVSSSIVAFSENK